MRKTLLCVALLAAGISAANAAQTTWQFTYQGFVNAANGTFDPNMKFTGTFSGDDTNSDGIIALDELTDFLSAGTNILDWNPYSEQMGGCAAGDWSSYQRCEIDQFSYKLTGELNYSLRTWGNDEGWAYWHDNVVIGSHQEAGGGNSDIGTSWSSRYEWSDQTTFTISPAPVPEPAAALMLPTGLALLLLARKRRRSLPR